MDWGLDFRPVKIFAGEGVEAVAAWIFWRGTSDGKVGKGGVVVTPCVRACVVRGVLT